MSRGRPRVMGRRDPEPTVGIVGVTPSDQFVTPVLHLDGPPPPLGIVWQSVEQVEDLQPEDVITIARRHTDGTWREYTGPVHTAHAGNSTLCFDGWSLPGILKQRQDEEPSAHFIRAFRPTTFRDAVKNLADELRTKAEAWRVDERQGDSRFVAEQILLSAASSIDHLIATEVH